MIYTAKPYTAWHRGTRGDVHAGPGADSLEDTVSDVQQHPQHCAWRACAQAKLAPVVVSRALASLGQGLRVVCGEGGAELDSGISDRGGAT
jgi:hypothetical protein